MSSFQESLNRQGANVGSNSRRTRYGYMSDRQQEQRQQQYQSSEERGRRRTSWLVALACVSIIIGVILSIWYIIKKRREVMQKGVTITIKTDKEYLQYSLKNAKELADYATRVEMDKRRRRMLVSKIVFGDSANVIFGSGESYNGVFLNNVPAEDIKQSFYDQLIDGESNIGRDDSGANMTTTDIVDRETIATKICPSTKYDIHGSNLDQIWGCFEKCLEGFETIWYAPRDGDKPLMVQVLDEKGKPKLKPGSKDEYEMAIVPPTAWCRAICPIKLVSSRPWSEQASSDFMSADAVPVLEDGKPKRTDAGDNNAYCERAWMQRHMQRGGTSIVCGWCDKNLDLSQSINGTSNNRHHCETSGSHYGIDFTPWCHRRRLIPNFRAETLLADGANKDNNLDTALCAAISGIEGNKKYIKYLQGPKACRMGDLLPIQAAAFFDKNSLDMVTYGALFRSVSSAVKIRDEDQTVARFGKDNYSIFQLACYEHCPPNMVPAGDIEQHVCAESCPANTTPLYVTGEFQYCKKKAYQKRLIFPDLMIMIDEAANAIAAKRNQTSNV